MTPAERALQDPAFAARFTVEGPLGEGAMGVVYRARQRGLERFVALKFLAAHLAGDGASHARFLAEGRLAAGLQHPNVVAVHDCGLADGVPYIATELVDGDSLETLLCARAPLPAADAIALARQLLDGLGAIHAAGIVHRDFKPANVLIAAGPPCVAKIADFGIAKALEPQPGADGLARTATGFVLGTPEYMAPEQAAGDRPTPAVDLYALGLILYRMVVGRHPFAAASVLEMLHKQVHAAPELPADMQPALRELLERGLAKLPEQRLDAPGWRAALDALAGVASAPRAPEPPRSKPMPTTQAVKTVDEPAAGTRVAGAVEKPASETQVPEPAGWPVASTQPARPADGSSSRTRVARPSKPDAKPTPPARPPSRPIPAPPPTEPRHRAVIAAVAVVLVIGFLGVRALRRSPPRPANLEQLDELLAYTFEMGPTFPVRKFFATVRKHPQLRDVAQRDVPLSQTARIVDRALVHFVGTTLVPADRTEAAQPDPPGGGQAEGPGEAGAMHTKLRVVLTRRPPDLDAADTILREFERAGATDPQCDAALLHPANAIRWFHALIELRNAETFKDFARAYRRLEICEALHKDNAAGEHTRHLLREIDVQADVLEPDKAEIQARKWHPKDQRNAEGKQLFEGSLSRLTDFVADTADVVTERWIRGPSTRLDERRFRRSLLLSWCILKTADKETGTPWTDRWEIPVKTKELDLGVDMDALKTRILAQSLGGDLEPLLKRVSNDAK